MLQFEIPEPEYDRYSNRQLAAIPLVVLLLAATIVGGAWVLTGTPTDLGIEFTGGTELTLQTNADRADLQAAFDEPIESIQGVQGENQYILEFSIIDQQALVDQAEANLDPPSPDAELVIGSREFSATFAGQQQQTALVAIVAAFLGMSILAFLFFRTFIPSIAIVVSAFSDLMIPLAVMTLFGIELSLGTVAALLMLIGYSVDSDILLNTHILKRSGDFYDSTYRAMQTGVTMTLTSMAAMAVMFVTGSLFAIEILAAIGLILTVGLAADLMNTYLLNLSLLRWYKFKGVAR